MKPVSLAQKTWKAGSISLCMYALSLRVNAQCSEGLLHLESTLLATCPAVFGGINMQQ